MIDLSPILLGFEVPSGEPVYLPPHHTGITGMTGLAGKTTANEAIATRSGVRTLTFLTKRGEGAYQTAKFIPLFYKERSDWRYVESLISAEMREDQRFNRAWIINACRGAKGLRDVWNNVKAAKEKARKDSLSERVYTVLDAYFEIVVPNIEKYTFSKTLEIGKEPSTYVMDLIGMPEAVQAVLIRSALEEILETMRDVWPTIPEAWKFIGEVHTPVTDVAVSIIKQGYAVGILLFIDSQDIASVNPKIRGQIDNWILGRQRYEHEVERTLSAISLPRDKKPKKEDIMTLKLGHFYAACSDWMKLVYVLPANVPESVGIEVAKGIRTPESIRDEFLKVKVTEDEKLYKDKCEEQARTIEKLERERKKAEEIAEALASGEDAQKLKEIEKTHEKELDALRISHEEELKALNARYSQGLQDQLNEADLNGYSRGKADAEEKINQVMQGIAEKYVSRDEMNSAMQEAKTEADVKIKAVEEKAKKLDALTEVLGSIIKIPQSPSAIPNATPCAIPSEISVSTQQPPLLVKQEKLPPLSLDETSREGKVAIIYAEGTLPADKWWTTGDVKKAFISHGWNFDPGIGNALDQFCRWGYFEKQMSGKRPDYKLKLSVEAAKAKGLIKEATA